MKNIILTILLVIITVFSTQAQVVINEIMYNSPDSNPDSIEFIELYNLGIANVNLQGWKFTEGITFTFPDITIDADGYLLIANKANTMMTLFGVDALQWAANDNLNTSGEDIILKDNNNNTVDSLVYDDNLPWVCPPDGDGPSLELIDPSSDNTVATNWKSSDYATGIIIANKEVFCTPGKENSSFATTGKVVINEIFYNAPNSGEDLVEFIELHNPGEFDVDISGYHFGSGIAYTFPASSTLGSKEYILLTKDTLGMINIFGIENSIQWDGGEDLNNGGDELELLNASGDRVDYVAFLDGNGWSAAADGDGASLELCDARKNNQDAGNWKASEEFTGLFISGQELLCTPGENNSVGCIVPDHFIAVTDNEFSPDTIIIMVGETVHWKWESGNHNVNGLQTSFPGNPEGFYSGEPSDDLWTFTYTFNTTGTYHFQSDGNLMAGQIIVQSPPPNDLVITEISYNQPGSGNDLDFIELHNQGSSTLSLDGYYFEDGVTHTFENVSIPANEYLVLCENAIAFENAFGIEAIQWNGGGLNDNGEPITLFDNNGELIDIVEFKDTKPWPEIGDGEGPSIIVCNSSEDNSVPSNWGFSTTNTGVIRAETSVPIFATPGAANDGCPTNPYIFLDNPKITKSEFAQMFNVEILMANTGPADEAQVNITVLGSSTASDPDDYEISGSTISFTSAGVGGVSVGSVTITLKEDADIEPVETIVLQLANPTNGAQLSDVNTITISIVDNDFIDPNEYPSRKIFTVTKLGNDFIPDSLGLKCQLEGIVHGLNLRPGGLEFTLIDREQKNDGISVFSFDDLGYTVAEGDELLVYGEITQFNGLTQITADGVLVITQNNPLHSPDEVTQLDELTESKMVRIDNLMVVDETPTGASGINYTVENDNGMQFTMRVDADVDIFGTEIPEKFCVIGIGGQFDDNDPFDEGYQILPRYLEDILVKVKTNGPQLGKAVKVYPNPVKNKLVVESDVQLETIIIHNVLGQRLMEFNNPSTTAFLNLETLTSGLYYVTVVQGEATWTESFVKE